MPRFAAVRFLQPRRFNITEASNEDFNLMHFATTSSNTMQTGMVIRKFRGQYIVRIGENDLPCSISSRLRKLLIYPLADPSSLHHRVQKVEEIDVVDPVAVGDNVSLVDAGDGTGVIHEVLERRTQLSRRAATNEPLEQVMVANADQAVVVFAAAKPEPKWNLLDRFLVTAESSDLPALIVITKMDLLDGDDLEEVEVYREIGYPVILTSSVDGRGIDEARAALCGKISILMGKSGVGKSSLLNAVQPGLGLKVSEVGKGELGKGKHTTTHLEMFPLNGGGGVIDTPGMRSFALWDVRQDEMAYFFCEMRPYLGKCQFQSNCIHENEPGCAVQQAVNTGQIDQRRYASYLKLLRE